MFTAIKKYISRNFIYPEVRIPSSRELNGLVVIVTGASRGIGKAVAEMIVNQGGKVVAVSREEQALKEAFPQQVSGLMLLQGNVVSEDDVQSIVKKAVERFGRVDVLINNAGINSEKALEDVSLSEFESVWGTNVKGAFLMSKYIIPHMKSAKNGLIINIGSKISHNTQVGPHKVLYATTKHAIEGFSFSLNRELRDFGIRVACLMPGTVNTFVSLKAKEFLSPYQVAEVVSMIIRFDDIDFEGLIFKSKRQNI